MHGSLFVEFGHIVWTSKLHVVSSSFIVLVVYSELITFFLGASFDAKQEIEILSVRSFRCFFTNLESWWGFGKKLHGWCR